MKSKHRSPAILVAMLLAKKLNAQSKVPLSRSIHEVLCGKSFILLLSDLLAGAVAGPE
jgi:hypothetical protein